MFISKAVAKQSRGCADLDLPRKVLAIFVIT